MSHKKFSSAQRAAGKAGPGDNSGDAPAAEVKIPVGRDTSEKTLKVTTESSREDADRQAIERGEDDGMIVHQSATPPDLEDLVRQGPDRLKQILPGGDVGPIQPFGAQR